MGAIAGDVEDPAAPIMLACETGERPAVLLVRPRLMSVMRARGSGAPPSRSAASSPDAALTTPYPASIKVSSSISRRRSSSSTRRMIDLSAASWESLSCILAHLSFSKTSAVHDPRRLS